MVAKADDGPASLYEQGYDVLPTSQAGDGGKR